MKKIRVVWGTRTPIGPSQPDDVRTMSMDFGSAKKAAEFACDVIYVLGGPECANAWSDEFYTVRPDKPRVRFDDRLRTWWVEVTAEYIDYCDFKSSAAGTTTRLDAKNEAAEVQ